MSLCFFYLYNFFDFLWLRGYAIIRHPNQGVTKQISVCEEKRRGAQRCELIDHGATGHIYDLPWIFGVTWHFFSARNDIIHI